MRILEHMSRCLLPVGLYHMVSNELLPHIQYVYDYRSVDRFRKDIDYLSRKYQFIALETLMKHLEGEVQIPGNAMLLTFDDGFAEMHDIVAPLLYQKGIPAVFFITTGCVDNRSLLYRNKASLLIDFLKNHHSGIQIRAVEKLLESKRISKAGYHRAILSIGYGNRNVLDEIAELVGFSFTEFLKHTKPYLTVSQLGEMFRMGFDMGAHSVDHPDFKGLSEGEMLHQVTESIDFLQRRNLMKYKAFAFPFNSNHISSVFLKDLTARKAIDISFGTNGIVFETRSRHLQRFYLDYKGFSIRSILYYYYLTGFIKERLNPRLKI